ncbi:MAG: S-layer homology domain-containing protein [Chloroflexi bacterium]|nr:S-layer homology domain-containing protein [Chloroflexota bacterium]
MKRNSVFFSIMLILALLGNLMFQVTPAFAAVSDKDITAFSFASPAAVGVITGTNIAVAVPYGTDVTALVATFTTNGASVAVGATPQVSGVTANDFTNPVIYTVTAADLSTKNFTVTVTVALNPAKDITAFSFASPAAAGVITGTSIAVTVPFGTSVTALVATFTTTGATVKVGTTVQVSGVTPNNFTSPRIYTVYAADGTTKNYTVTVTVAPDITAKDITSFSFASPAATGVITGTNIAVHVPFGTNVTALVPTIVLSGGTVSPLSGVAQDFTSPVIYTVTAIDLSTKVYTVTVTIDPLSSAKAITSFAVPGQVGLANINEVAHTIGVTVPFGTNVTALVATFVTTGTSVAVGATPQVSGVTVNDFTSPVVYTVTAADASTQNYTVTVTIAAPSSNKAITSFTVPGQTGLTTINEGAHTISITVPFGTNVTALVATFATNGVSVKVGATVQVSGVTANDFTSPITYTVTAQDASTQDYVVTIAPNITKDITSFSFTSPAATGVITGTNIAVTVPYGTNVTALVATFTTNGTSVVVGVTPQVSGVTPNDFTSPVIYTVTGLDASTKDYTVTVTVALNPAKDITAFSFSSPAATGVITGTNIAVNVPYGTNVTALVATFTTTGASVKVGATVQVSGVTPNNFTSPRVYTVTAADGTTKNYTVTVTVAVAPKDITAFSFTSPAAIGVITGTNIAVTVPFGTDVTALVATFTTTGTSVKVGATVQVSGTTANDFSSPVIYTVTAIDDSTKDYTVTVTIAPNPAKDITAFSFISPVVDGIITGTNIAVTVPFGTNVTALAATFTTTGASVTVGGTPQISGITANDFTNPVTYIVTAADSTTKAYTVTVTIAANTAKDITAFGFISPAVDGVITGTNIAVTVPFGTNVTALVAIFTTTGNSVAVGATPQVSGITANNFTSPVTYTVTAADTTTKDFVVTVTIAANTAKAITSFTIPGQVGLTDINEGAGVITVHVPYLTNVTALVPTIAISGESVAPLSGVAQNFTNPVDYTVTAADLSTKVYTVTVIVDAQAAHPTITASGAGTVLPGSQYTYTFTYTTDANIDGTQVAFTLPSHATYVSDSGSFCGEAGGIVTCNLGSITTAGGSFTVTVAVDKLKKIDTPLTLSTTSYSVSAIGVPVTNGAATVTANTLTLFADAAAGYWALDSIQAIWSAGITGGCIASPLTYCPGNPVTRAQMAVFLVRSMHGIAFVPPTATGIFNDVPVGSFGADFIEQLAADGITSGCGSNNFCPNQVVTRAQMAIFLVRSMHGTAFVPPTATGIFADVPIGSFGADFIEQLAADSITSGCGGGNFCPGTTVKRDQMAVFIQKVFASSIPLPTP